MTEILAPCGSPEVLHAALRAGCTAVYLGGEGKLGGGASYYEGRELVFGFRPEAIKLGSHDKSYKINCNVELTEMLGDNTNVYITAGDQRAILKVDPHDTPEIDSKITFSIPYENVYLFDGETELVI